MKRTILDRPMSGRSTAAAVLAVIVCSAVFVLAAPSAGASPTEDTRPAAVSPPAPTSHAATTANTMTFNGRGWGHGRGLSQYGSQGYATRHNWTSAQILDHYYGGTHAGSVTEAANLLVDPEAVRIRLMAQNGKPTVIGITDGTLKLAGSQNVIDPGGLTAVRLSMTETEADGLLVESAPTCAGPWTVVGPDGRSGSREITVTRATGSELLHLCREDGVTMWYPGSLRAHLHDTGDGLTARTINITTMEEQLRSVVPRESPASWSQAALEAQSVAARSYALAGDSRHVPYADTCDTTLCQVYAGHHRKDPGGERSATTDPRTDAAIAATAGIVRLTTSNRVARTEFSSTSGGWTAGGTFPAVEDLGDVISPLHTWTRTLAVTSLEETYGEGGTLVEIEVLARNGLGADGGRVTKARLHFSSGVTRDVSGNTVRSKVRMLSDWFTPTCPQETRYVNAVHQLFLERSATGDEIELWCSPVRRGERFSLTEQLSVSDEWAGVQISGLYQKILGRNAEAKGRAFWLAQVERGLRIEDIAAEFYGSAEYFDRVGNTHTGFVTALYDDLLGRPADDRGRDFWVGMLDSKSLGRTEAASEFYASIESRSGRVHALFEKVLGRQAESSGLRFWAEELLELGDVALSAWLAASDEYFRRTTA